VASHCAWRSLALKITFTNQVCVRLRNAQARLLRWGVAVFGRNPQEIMPIPRLRF
jgi:hypothetical protein